MWEFSGVADEERKRSDAGGTGGNGGDRGPYGSKGFPRLQTGTARWGMGTKKRESHRKGNRGARPVRYAGKREVNCVLKKKRVVQRD